MNHLNCELTQAEKHKAESLARALCNNYGPDYGFLPLERDCYMLGVRHTHSPLCKYLRDAVLPTAPKPEALFCASG